MAGELPVDATERGWVRTAPGTLEAEGGCDGFFIARFRRDGAGAAR
jgi:16S rRNA (cytosine967-C5)-methyltransferase